MTIDNDILSLTRERELSLEHFFNSGRRLDQAGGKRADETGDLSKVGGFTFDAVQVSERFGSIREVVQRIADELDDRGVTPRFIELSLFDPDDEKGERFFTLLWANPRKGTEGEIIDHYRAELAANLSGRAGRKALLPDPDLFRYLYYECIGKGPFREDEEGAEREAGVFLGSYTTSGSDVPSGRSIQDYVSNFLRAASSTLVLPESSRFALLLPLPRPAGKSLTASREGKGEGSVERGGLLAVYGEEREPAHTILIALRLKELLFRAILRSSYAATVARDESRKAQENLKKQQAHSIGTMVTFMMQLLEDCLRDLPSGDFLSSRLQTVQKVIPWLARKKELSLAESDWLTSTVNEREFRRKFGSVEAVRAMSTQIARESQLTPDGVQSAVATLDAIAQQNLGDPLKRSRKSIEAVQNELRSLAVMTNALLRIDDGDVRIRVRPKPVPFDRIPANMHNRTLIERLARALVVTFTAFFSKAFPRRTQPEATYFESATRLFPPPVGEELARLWMTNFVEHLSSETSPSYIDVVGWLDANVNSNPQSRLRIGLPPPSDETTWIAEAENEGLLALEAVIEEALLNALKYVRPADDDGVARIELSWHFGDNGRHLRISNTAREQARPRDGHYGVVFLEYAGDRLFHGMSVQRESRGVEGVSEYVIRDTGR